MQEAFLSFLKFLINKFPKFWVILVEKQLYATALPSIADVSLLHLNIDLFPSLKNLPEHRIRPKFLFEFFTKKNITSEFEILNFYPAFLSNYLISHYLLSKLFPSFLQPHSICVSRLSYEKFGGTKLTLLQPGNYSVIVRATSLAGNGSFTETTYFFMPSRKTR